MTPSSQGLKPATFPVRFISFTDPGLLVTAVRAFAADPLKVSELLFNGETPTETVSGITASVEVLGRSQTFYMSKIQEKAYGTISDGGPAVVVEASTQLPVSLPNGQAVNATYSVSTEASFSFSGGFPSSGVPASATELLIFAAAGSAFAMGGQASQAKIQDLLKDFEVPRGVATI
jgi:hypothetical protein